MAGKKSDRKIVSKKTLNRVQGDGKKSRHPIPFLSSSGLTRGSRPGFPIESGMTKGKPGMTERKIRGGVTATISPNRIKRMFRPWALLIAFLLVIQSLTAGVPWFADQPFKPAAAQSNEFTMNSGYYSGSGVARSITGVGFQPDLVIIKSDTSTGYAVWRSSAMSGDSTAYFASGANITTGITSLDSNGFSLGTNAAVNTLNIRYTWTAFGSSGSTNFKVGTYTGTGGDNRSITGVGFTPDLVWVKGNAASQNGVWRSSAMTGDVSQYFDGINQSSNIIQVLETDGFQVGDNAGVNTAAATYFYAAFKITTNKFQVGTYTGNGVDNRSITGIGFQPDLAWTKLATAATAQIGVMRNNQLYGDESHLFTGAANVTDRIQGLEADGFQIGTNAQVNSSTAGQNTYYWAAWAGVPAPGAPSGEFSMNSGYYVGSGVARSITGVGFQPNLVIIRGDTTQNVVWRSSTMSGDSTAYFIAAVNATTGITSLDSNGFSLGTGTNVNSLNIRYTWTAFSNSGSTNFKVGAYTGTGGDNRSITGIGFQPDLVWAKGNVAQAGVWRSSAMAGDVSQYFMNTNQGSDLIQALETDGFQVGTLANVNTAATTYFYAAFKITTNKFNVGTYAGDGLDNRSITGVGFKPDMVWDKLATATVAQTGVLRNNQLYGDESQSFIATANTVDLIQALETDGFQVGTDARVNSATASENTYYWMAWTGVPAPSAPSGEFTMNSGYYVGSGVARSITGVGFQPDLVIIKSDTAAGSAVWRSSTMSGDSTAYFATATANFTGGITSLDSNGFSLGISATVNTLNIRYTWTAFGSSGSTNFKVGAYTGTGGDNRSITGVGFTPDLVWVKGNTAQIGGWRSSAMAGDVSQYFSAANQAADLIQALETDGFQIGTITNVNTAATIYFYAAFKTTTGKFNVGTYAGNGQDNRSITGIGFKPDMVWDKLATATTAQLAVMRNNQLYGDESHLFTGTVNAVNNIQAFETDGFQIGTNAQVNSATAGENTYYWAAWKGVPAPSAPSGEFTMKTGSYTGNGTSQSITGIGFQPDLVTIKSDTLPATLGYTVWRSSLIGGANGDSTAYLGVPTANFAGGITSLDSNGFSVGAGNDVNASSVTYRWIAFGNSGSTNFKVGTYTGTGGDNRSITGIGFQPDLVWVKPNSAPAAVWRSSAMAGDVSQYFNNYNQAADLIQALETDGFQVGASAAVNGSATTYFYVAFKTSSGKFNVGSYTGDGNNDRVISTSGMDPDWVWVKRTTAVNGVHRSNTLTEDNTQYFNILANAANLIDQLQTGGFRVDNGAGGETNASGGSYFWAAWAAYAPLDHFTVVETSGQQLQDTPFPITITAKDISDNVTNKVSAAVDLTVSSGTILPLSVAASEFTDDGTWTGNVTISGITGAPTVTITATSGGKTGSDSLVIVGTPGPLDHFNVDAPATANSGEAFSATVTAKDAWNLTTINVGSTDVTVGVTSGIVVPASIAISELTDDGIYTGYFTISGIVEVVNVTLSFTVNPTGSDVISVTGVPANPNNVSASRISDIELTVSWQDTSTVEASWKIERDTDNGSGFEGWVEIGSVTAGVTGFTDNAANNPTDPPQADKRYQYRVRAQNAIGYGGYGTDSATHYTTPNAPGSAAGARVSNSEFSISWTDLAAVTNTHRPQRDSNNDDYLTDLGTFESSPQSDITGLIADSKYRWRMRAEAGGLPSNWSYSAYEYTQPAASSSVLATANSSTQLTVSWNDGSAYEDGFRVWGAVSGGEFAEITPGENTVGAGVNSYVYSSALPNRAYQFKVFAHIGATPTNGELLSDEALSETTYSLANIPANLAVAETSSSALTVSFTANDNRTGTEYFIENITNATDSGWITGLSWAATGLSASTEYSFRVKARNGAAVPVETEFSSTVSAVTLASGVSGGRGFRLPTPEEVEEVVEKILPPPFREPAGGFSIKINDDAFYTTSRQVVLTLEGGPDAVKYIVSEDPSFSGAVKRAYGEESREVVMIHTLTRNGSVLALFTLSVGDGLKTVYAQFFNKADKASEVVSHAITLDSQPPQFTLLSPRAGQILAVRKPVFSGSAEVGSTITLTLNSVLIYQTLVPEEKDWLYESKEELNNGNYELVITAQDAAGNQASPLRTQFVIKIITVKELPKELLKPELKPEVKPEVPLPLPAAPEVPPKVEPQPIVPEELALIAPTPGLVEQWRTAWGEFTERVAPAPLEERGRQLAELRGRQLAELQERTKLVREYWAERNQQLALALRGNTAKLALALRENTTLLAQTAQDRLSGLAFQLNDRYLAFVGERKESAEARRLVREEKTRELALEREKEKTERDKLALERRLAQEEQAQQLALEREKEKEERQKLAEEYRLAQEEKAQQLALEQEKVKEENAKKLAERQLEQGKKLKELAEAHQLRLEENQKMLAERRQQLAALWGGQVSGAKMALVIGGQRLAERWSKLQLALRIPPRIEQPPLIQLASQPPASLKPEQLAFVSDFGNIDIPTRNNQLRLTAGMRFTGFVKMVKPVNEVKGELILIKELSIGKQSKLLSLFFVPGAALAAESPLVVVAKDWLVAEYVFTDPEGDNIWSANIQLPPVEGEYRLAVSIAYKTGVTKTIEREVLIDPEGYVFTPDPRGEIRLKDVMVSLEWPNSVSKEWELWPAELYAQENPQRTPRSGDYSFLVPAGLYRLKTEIKGYLPYQSEEFTVREGEPVHQIIELQPESGG